MAITSYTKDTDAISFVEDGVTKKVSVTGSDIVVSWSIEDMDQIIYIHRRQSDGYVIIGYFDTNGDKQEIELYDPDGTFLPLAGGTLTGDLTIRLNKLITNNLLLKEGSSNFFYIRNAADDAFKGLDLDTLYFRSLLYCATDGGILRAFNADGGYLVIQARDTGVGNAEIARLVGAADPYFQMTLPMRLYPAAIPGTLVEGHFGYGSVADKLWYRDASATQTIATETYVDAKYVPRTYVWFISGTVAVGTEQGPTFRMKRATTIEDIELHIKTAPTGAALIVDINDGGTTIFSTEPEIDISGTTEDDNHVISDTALAATTELTMDIVQVGSTVAGADLTVLLHCKEAVI